ncbi:MAG: histidine--tRNA ligase [Acidobacteria bacterium]|nr:histidine--tRNA ligase [Acidobacteriota bacterium]MCW5948596.1 histidine--tRNA ligase [Pyrinomonadaceae bacterium]
MASTNPARGMRDFLPADVRKREYVIGIIKEVYESYGFEPLETPAVENLETLTGKYGEEGNQLIFKILKRGEKLDLSGAAKESDLSDLALRYDLTVPLARVVANNKNELPKFFKRYQIQRVWRADRPARGRFREFYQCDVDCIGSDSLIVEAEIISAAGEILSKLGFVDFEIRINHRELLRSIVATAGIQNETDALVALDKLDKIGSDGVKNELLGRGISEVSADRFLDAIRSGSSNDDLDTVQRLCVGLPIRIDPSLARGLSYYTGTIMEIVLTEGDFKGSIGGGGRYDGLIGMFGKEQIPACGFSLGFERILVVMEERGMFPPEIADSTPADVMVTIWSSETIHESLRLAHELRSRGLRVTMYPEPDKLGKQIKYADSIRVPWVCVLGDSELADSTVTVKNMRTGDQQTIARDRAASAIQK